MKKNELLGVTRAGMDGWIQEQGLPKYTASQILQWIYRHHCPDPAAMTNLSRQNRERLSAVYESGASAPLERAAAADGTLKYLFPVEGESGRFVESAVIPDNGRATLCLSTQSGCRMGCVFCQTGRQGLGCNLTSGAILNQFHSLPEREQITNIVYMGMGEPFDNTDAVLQSLEAFTAEWGYAMSPTRITVSTAGLIPGMVRFLEESRCHLAVSLHSPRQRVREQLLPVARRYPLEQLFAALENHRWEPQRRLTFEYIVFPGMNDTSEDVQLLARQARRLHARINLLSWHRVPELDLPGSSREQVEQFQAQLQRHGVTVTVRRSRGEEIGAACGLLSTRHRDGR